ncbi:histidine kinase dimerization/phosphoacceptor domain -containing protein [Leptobacterium flavescens]|nr:histidine kinase dimerization/phosphoacceptor domain -containing protein [Leptobacterium flavescens]
MNFMIVLSCFSQENNESTDAFLRFQQASSIDKRFEIFFDNDNRYIYNSAFKWLDKVSEYLTVAENAKDAVQIYQYKTILSQIQIDLGDYKKGALIAEKLYKDSKKLDMPVRKQLLRIMDEAYGELRLFEKQLEVRTEMKKNGDRVILYDIYSNLGLHRQAMMDYIIEAESKIDENDLYANAEHNNNLGTYLRRDGSIYTAKKKLDTALTYIDAYLNDTSRNLTAKQFRDAVFLKGAIQGNLGKCDIALGNYESAIPLLEAGVSSSKEYDKGKYSGKVIDMWTDLANSHLQLGNPFVAKSYLDSISATSRITNIVDFNYLLAEYYLRVDEADSASHHYKEYIRFKDSVNDNSTKKELLGLLVSFDLENQKATIQKQRQDIEKTKAQILQRDRKINYSIYALAFLLIGLGAVAFAYFKSVKNKRLIEDQNKIIEASLVEKDSLLKEIHHRVKNNLQMVSSLLSMQTKNTRSKEAIEALEEGKSRVKAMALIHQKLYQNEGLSVIEMQGYVESLVNSIQSVYKKGGHDVNINIDAEGAELDIDRAIPIGLILNELVSNSFKYAFPNKESGQIYINIRMNGEEGFFEYQDNGKGLPDDLEERSNNSMGVKLIQRLVNQLRSNLNIDNSVEGARFWFNFK